MCLHETRPIVMDREISEFPVYLKLRAKCCRENCHKLHCLESSTNTYAGDNMVENIDNFN